MNLKNLLLTTVSLLFLNGAALSENFNSPFEMYSNNSAIEVNFLSSSDLKASCEFSLKEFEITELNIDGSTYDLVNVPGGISVGPDGWPSLPRVTRFMIIPPTSGVDVRVLDIKTRVEDNINPLPRQPIPVDVGDFDILSVVNRPEFELVVDQSSLNTNGLWPEQPVELGRPVIMRGHRILPITINPMRWNSQTGDLIITESLEMELNFDSDKNKVNLVKDPVRPKPSMNVQKILETLVMNPPAPSRDDIKRGSIVYVVDEDNDWDEVREGLEPLIEWRRRMGWTVELLEVDGTTDREDVKEAIQDAYDSWEVPPEYVVLVGDAPHRIGNQHIIAYWNHAAGSNYPYESDHDYVRLEGDDVLPDAAIGRLMLDSNQNDFIENHVNKIVDYESAPYLGEDDDEIGWQLRGAVTSTDPRSGESSIDVCRWYRNLLLRNGFDDVDELYFNAGAVNPTQFIGNNVGGGCGFFLYRGWTNMNGYTHVTVNTLRNEGMLPFVILATCNTGDYGEQIYNIESFAERFAYHDRGGAIGCIGAAGATHTAYNNMLSATSMGAPFIHDITHSGWMLMLAKVDLWRHYANYDDIQHAENLNAEAWDIEFHIFNLHGDPAVDVYTGIPIALEVVHPAEIRSGESSFDVLVVDEENEEPVQGALVCLYKPEEFQLTALTNEDGEAHFAFDPTSTMEGEIQLTITGHNLYPYLEEFEIGTSEYFIASGEFVIDDDNEDSSEGDGDGVANPTEVLELALEIFNYGSDVPEGEGTATLSTNHPHLSVNQGEFEFDTAPNAEESITANYVVEIEGGFKNGEMAKFELEVVIGEETWQSSVSIPVDAPQFELVSAEWDGGALRRADNAALSIEIINVGSKASGALEGSLISFTNTIQTPENSIEFEAADVDEAVTSENTYTVTAKWNHIGGQRGDLALELISENGIIDTVFFPVYAADAVQSEPFGPDRYGYVCYESTDDAEWFVRPVYNWIELNPEDDGNGIDTELDDPGENRDESAVFDMPFEFQYYGETFDQVTICTNGWIAMGNQSTINTGRNRKMPGGEVVSAMIAPFWEDLRFTNDSKIFYTDAADSGRFIVQWDDLIRLGPRGSNEAHETFQVILYDPAVYQTFSGDGEIVFQYQDIADEESYHTTWDVPYASIGIASPDQSDGFTYTYWNERPPGAAPIENELAIKFSTMIDFDFGFLQGFVWDAADSTRPIEGVEIRGSYGAFDITDENGMYIIEALANPPEPYTLTASKVGWNDSTLSGIDLLPDSTTLVNFGLLHPEFDLQIVNHHIQYWIRPGDTLDYGYTLSNPGNGSMWYTSYYDYLLQADTAGARDDADEIWDNLVSWNATTEIDENLETVYITEDLLEEPERYDGDAYLRGITFANDQWIVSGGNNLEDINYFYIFDKFGNFEDTLRQPELGRNGLYEIEYYDGYLYAVNSTDKILKIDLENGLIVDTLYVPDIAGPTNLNRVRNMTIDPETGDFWVAQVNTDVYRLVLSDTSDVLVESGSFPLPDERALEGETFRSSGLAWYPDEPEGYKLFLVSNENPDDLDEKAIAIFQLNPETGDVRYMTDLLEFERSLNEGGEDDIDIEGKLGITITPKWHNMVWVMAGLFNGGSDGDFVGVFELGPNASWVRYSPIEDTLIAGEDQELYFKFNTLELDSGEYGVLVVFDHNSVNELGNTKDTLRIDMVVTLDANSDESAIPLAFSLDQNYPNPFNSMTNISYTIPALSDVKMELFDVTGRRIATLLDSKLNAGRYRASFNATELPNGVYMYRLEAGANSITRKMVLLK